MASQQSTQSSGSQEKMGRSQRGVSACGSLNVLAKDSTDSKFFTTICTYRTGSFATAAAVVHVVAGKMMCTDLL